MVRRKMERPLEGYFRQILPGIAHYDVVRLDVYDENGLVPP
jgi:hypothetical protein